MFKTDLAERYLFDRINIAYKVVITDDMCDLTYCTITLCDNDNQAYDFEEHCTQEQKDVILDKYNDLNQLRIEVSDQLLEDSSIERFAKNLTNCNQAFLIDFYYSMMFCNFCEIEQKFCIE
jgi:hypothetical protein